MAKKEHYFELVMNSYSGGELNQEVVLVREYANTPGELTYKQMEFSKKATMPIIQAVLDAMDQMSAPVQEIGQQELLEAFAAFGKPAKGKAKR